MVESKISLHSKVDLERAEGCEHSPNINQQKEGVKKKQEKG